MEKTKHDCMTCKYRAKISGDAHSKCNADAAKGDVKITNKNAIANGWANYPHNFDPRWIASCKLYVDKNATTVSPEKIQEILTSHKTCFKVFLQCLHPELSEHLSRSSSHFDELFESFNTYLNETCTAEQLENFMPISPMQLLTNMSSPIHTAGFHPAYCLHFVEFVKIQLSNGPETEA